MPAAAETISPSLADGVLAWARLCGVLIAREWKTTVRISPATTHEISPAGRWRLAIGENEVAVVLADERLLRAFSHAVHAAMSLPLGAGMLTDVEQGLIDFLSTKLLHALGPHSPSDTPALTAIDFDGVATNESAAALAFVVAVGGIAGRLRVELPAIAVESLPSPAFTPDADGSASAEAFVELATVPLSDAEWQHLEPGDAVTLALSSLLDRPLAVQTQNGRRLGRARAVIDSPTLLTVEFTDIAQAALSEPADHAAVRLATPMKLSIEAPLTIGQRIDFARTAADVVVERDGEFWQGELVRIDGELAVRLLGKTDGGRP
ncbi:MAG: hypothetical protein QM754_01855 [Tepidisphaeraceae bacterium]